MGRVACILVIIGVSLVAIWSACYFIWLYKKDSVTTGNDGVGFVKATRKQEVVITLYIACCIDALDPETPEEDKKDEEEKKSEKADDDKKSEKKSEKADDAKAEEGAGGE